MMSDVYDSGSGMDPVQSLAGSSWEHLKCHVTKWYDSAYTLNISMPWFTKLYLIEEIENYLNIIIVKHNRLLWCVCLCVCCVRVDRHGTVSIFPFRDCQSICQNWTYDAAGYYTLIAV